MAGLLFGASAVGGIYMLNNQRLDDLRQVQREEAWSRYESGLAACVRGNRLRTRLEIPLVRCYDTVPLPTVPKPR